MRGPQVLFTVFLPFALGHFLSAMLRTVNAVLAPSLVASLGLTSGQLGLLTSALFLAFALVQLPVGMALDRYGPRRVQTVLLMVAAGGALLFAHGTTFGQLVAARAIIGAGLGGCFMSAVKAISASFAPARLPSVQGYMIAVGGLGAASATMPVRMALEVTDWRGVFTILAALSAGCALLIWAAAPRSAAPPDARTPAMASVLALYRNPAFRRAASLMLIPHAVFFGVQALWIGRWLSDVSHYSEAAVAWLLYLSMAAVIFGSIAVGMLTEWAGRHGVGPLDVGAVGIALFLLVQLGAALNYLPSLALLSVLFSLVGTITGLEYAIVAQSMPATLTGRASTCLNLLIFVGAFVVQTGFGLLLGMWQPDMLGRYPVMAYRVAFGVLVLIQLPGLATYLHARYRLSDAAFSHAKNSST
jgi:MFS family permease